mgnify:CR=1 FL=1
MIRPTLIAGVLALGVQLSLAPPTYRAPVPISFVAYDAMEAKVREAGARNFDFPKQVCEGVTVIGINAEVPKGLRVGSGCLIGARVAAGQMQPQEAVKAADGKCQGIFKKWRERGMA